MSEIEEKVHAERGPSKAARWTRCAGSIVLERGRDKGGNEHSRWGTVAHEVADYCLQPFVKGEDPYPAKGFIGRVFTVEGHEIKVDDEIADCVDSYIDSVQSYIDPMMGDVLMTEQSLPIGHITGEKDAIGTSDVVGFVDSGERGIIIDLKGGRGVRVDADGNEQMLLYAAGARDEYDLLYQPKEWTLVIIQPRLGHISEWTITAEELAAKVEWFKVKASVVDNAEEVARQNGNLAQYLDPGEKQCRFCNAKAICPALAGEVVASVKHNHKEAAAVADFDDLSDVPQTVDQLREQVTVYGLADADEAMETLGVMRKSLPLIRAWCDAVDEEVHNVLFAGGDVPGFKLVEGRSGHRQWRDAKQAEESLKGSPARLKMDEVYNKTVISPTQAEKLLKEKPKVWAKIAPLIADRTSGKPVVVEESDKRPAWTPPVTADDFEDLSEGENKNWREGVEHVVPLAQSHPEYVMNTPENIALRFELAKQAILDDDPLFS